MIIYLDESKRLAKWQIVISWFITKHNNNYINEYIINKKKEYWLFSNIELKSIKDTWKIFYEKMINDENFKIISTNIIWVNILWCFKDNKEKYIEIISILIWKIYIWIKNHKADIKIVADFLAFWKNNNKVEKEIEKVLNKKYPLYKGYKFRFVNSNKYLWVQLSDLITYQLRLVNITKSKKIDNFIQENNFNINLIEVIKI
jgi:hypothetical protein